MGQSTAETAILRDMGVQVTAFEPYPQVRNRVDIDAGKTSARQLLEAVEKGTEWDTIFLAFVFNAVPFLADRQYIVTICATLCSAHTRLFACARSIRDSVWESVKSGSGLSCRTRNLQAFPVDGEVRLLISSLINGQPKAQKYHTTEEFYHLFKGGFNSVQVGHCNNATTAICAQSHWTPEALAEALRFEFDLPYTNGNRMGLASRALDAFSRRLRVSLR